MIHHNYIRAVIEMLLLWVVVALSTSSLIKAHIQKRCRALRIPIPGVLPFMTRIWLIICSSFAVMMIAIMCAVFVAKCCQPYLKLIMNEGEATNQSGESMLFILLYGVLIVGMLLLLYIMRVVFHADKSEGRYIGTKTRSVVPVYALAILIICLFVHPYLEFREYALINSKESIFAQLRPESQGLSDENRFFMGLFEELRIKIADIGKSN